MGLGFNFGGKDAGLSKAVDGALSSVSKLTAGIAGVSSAMGQLAEQGRDPTTPFEAQMTANNVSLTSMAANLGKSGEPLKKFTQQSQALALTMNRSAEEAGNATGQFDRMSDAQTAAGINSAATLLKLADVSGVNATVFADASNQMMKMKGMSKEAGASILDSMTAAGQATGDVAGALHETATRMALLQKRSALLAQGFVGIGIEEFSKQIDSTAVSMQKATKVSASTARAFATGLAESIQNSAQAFKELTVGTGEDVPEMLKAMALTTGDVEKAFHTMEGGTEGFMDTMRTLTKNMGGDKDKIGKVMTWLQAKTGEAFGPERSKEIVNYLSTATEETDKQGKAIKKASGALQAYAKEGFKTGYTDARRMELAEEMFVARLRNINKTSKIFADETSKSFNLLGGEIETLGKDKGPVGQLTNTLIDLDQKGLIGLLPTKLQGTAVAMGGFAKRLGKTLEGILNPLNLAESGVVLFATAMTDAFMKQDKKTKMLSFMDRIGLAFESVANDAVNYLETLPDKITGVMDSISKTLGGFFDGKGGASGKWGTKIRAWWGRILVVFTKMEPIIARIRTFAVDLWEGIVNTLDPSTQKDTDSVGTKMGQWIRSGWDVAKKYFDDKVWPVIKKFGNDFWVGIRGALGTENADPNGPGYKIGKWINEAFDAAITKVTDALPGLLWDLFKFLVKSAVKGLIWVAQELSPAKLAGRAFDALTGPSDPIDADAPSGPGATISKKTITKSTPDMLAKSGTGMATAALVGATDWPAHAAEKEKKDSERHREMMQALLNKWTAGMPGEQARRVKGDKPSVSGVYTAQRANLAPTEE